MAPTFNRPVVEWESKAHILDHESPFASSCGLVALSTDGVIESEMGQFFRSDCRTLFTSRIAFHSLTPEGLTKLENQIPNAIDMIMPESVPSVFAFGCASGAIAIGPENVVKAFRGIHPDALITDPMTASIAAFEALNVRKIGILTPYPEAVNQIIEKFFYERGIKLVKCLRFDLHNSSEISWITPDSIVSAALEFSQKHIDALFISCTALRTLNIIEKIENKIQRPVISCNQALAWHSIRLLGDTRKIDGYGHLLRLQRHGCRSS